MPLSVCISKWTSRSHLPLKILVWTMYYISPYNAMYHSARIMSRRAYCCTVFVNITNKHKISETSGTLHVAENEIVLSSTSSYFFFVLISCEQRLISMLLSEPLSESHR